MCIGRIFFLALLNKWIQADNLKLARTHTAHNVITTDQVGTDINRSILGINANVIMLCKILQDACVRVLA